MVGVLSGGTAGGAIKAGSQLRCQVTRPQLGVALAQPRSRKQAGALRGHRDPGRRWMRAVAAWIRRLAPASARGVAARGANQAPQGAQCQ